MAGWTFQKHKTNNIYRAKAAAIVLLMILSVAIFQAEQTESLYPWVPVAVVTSTFTTLAVGRGLDFRVWVLFAVGLGTIYRLFLYLWPSSYIGLDPDRVAAAVNRVAFSGQIESISGLGFYRNAPLFHIYTAEVAHISGVSVKTAFAVYALLLGVLGPIVSAYIAAQLAPDEYTRMAAGLAATLGAVGVMTWKFAYWPLPQILAVLFWAGYLIAFFRLISQPSRRNWVPIYFFLIGLFFTHKLGVLICAIASLMALLIRTSMSFRASGLNNLTHDPVLLKSGIIALALFLIQFMWLTEWIRSVFLTVLLPLLGERVSASPPAPPSFTQAIPLNRGIVGTVVGNVGWLVLTGLAALATPIMWWFRQDTRSAAVVGVVVAHGVTIGFALLSTNLSLERLLLLSEWSFSALVVLSGFWVGHSLVRSELVDTISAHQNTVQSVVIGALIVFAGGLILAQVATVTVTPDHPAGPRWHLTNSELHSKMSMTDYAPNDVGMDGFYAHELTPSQTEIFGIPYRTGHATATPGTAPLNGSLLNGSFNQKYVAIRPGVDRVRGPLGGYQLQYNPSQHMSQSAGYNKVYSSNGAALYQRNRTEG